MTADEVAPVLRVTPYQVTQLCKSGKLRATKPGRNWLIEPAAVHEFLESGRPEQGAA